MLVGYFIVTFCDLTLTLTFCKYTLRTYAVSFPDIYPALWVSLTSARLTDPRAQKVITLHCDLWPDLDLTRDLNLKMLSMDYVHLDESFQTPARPSPTTLSFTTTKNTIAVAAP